MAVKEEMAIVLVSIGSWDDKDGKECYRALYLNGKLALDLKQDRFRQLHADASWFIKREYKFPEQLEEVQRRKGGEIKENAV